jgi:hypothetical protein
MIDWNMVMAAISTKAEGAVRRSTEFALGRARHHAPVRAIFKRDRRGPAFTRQGPIVTATQYRAYLRSRERQRRLDIRPEQGQRRTRDIPGIEGPVTITEGSRTARLARQSVLRRGGSFAGHANSLLPVFQEGDFRITGDFRRASRVPDVIRQRAGQASRVTRAESIQTHRGMFFRGDPSIESFRSARLSARGRFEVLNARVARQGVSPSGKAFAFPPMYQGRVGGRLRGEIRMIEPRWIGKTVWGYVESPTPYARYQEYGTRRSRAHPYLRPALYESRKVLIAEARKEFA